MGLTVSIGVDLGFTAFAVDRATRGRRPDRRAGLTQTALTIPQVVGGLALLKDDPTEPAFIGMTLWAALLAGHGMAAILSPRGEAFPLFEPRENLRIAPIPISDGKNRAFGLGVRGRFE